MDKEKLKQEREKAFDAWLDWWDEESNAFKNMEEQIKKRNLEGYTSIKIKIEYTEDQPSIRIGSDLFLESLRKRFKGFKVSREWIKKPGELFDDIGVRFTISWD